MNTKKIKIDIVLDGVKISNLEELQNRFSAEILPIFQSGRLAKWLSSRGMVAEGELIQKIDSGADAIDQLDAICCAIGLESDRETLGFLLDDWDLLKKEKTLKEPNKLLVDTNKSKRKTLPLDDEVVPSGEKSDSGSIEGGNVSQKFCGMTFKEKDFSKMNFTGQNFANAAFIDCDFSDTNFTSANLDDVKFTRSDLTGAIFEESSLRDALFIDCNCGTGANVSMFSLGRNAAKFIKANLHQATFMECNLQQVVFNNCVMTESELKYNFLCAANFLKSNISRSNFEDNKYVLYHINKVGCGIKEVDHKAKGIIYSTAPGKHKQLDHLQMACFNDVIADNLTGLTLAMLKSLTRNYENG